MSSIISKDNFKNILNKFSDVGPILVIGDIGLDKYTFGEVKRISPEAPVPVLEVTKEWTTLGLATNISNNLSTLGVSSTICGVVGEDMQASKLESLLEESDLSIWGVVRCSERPTIFKERVTTSSQQICRVDYEDKSGLSASTQERLIERIKEFIPTHSGIIIEDYGKGTLSKETISEVVSLARKHNKKVFVDPSRTTPPEFYKGVDLLKPNRIEAELMVSMLGHNTTDVLEMAKILSETLDIEQVVITLGGEGMAIFSRGESKVDIIPTVANEVFDVSGAGDTAISLLSSSLLAGSSLRDACWLGNCGSGVVVAKKGTATVNLEELEKFYDNISKNFNE
ncbi:bifunctional heptose 7-phosphate kinase/heptose 1-phosphate adenyltransferase [Halobacteriovorax marinus]|uniref:bifunctional heptose 7-phosphate kinase/heptose 1-phosphate adenyltransferase n=1 Tax=Halobacteriovorax marinus TaxID=97084 RepID=UPI000BDF04AD|nr:PfkB family carbohydrate kinase [Halobacteriovorax marinus]